ncbi:hypothetical protein ATM97_28800 [Nocardia sp. MH4]|uniref:Uncharacterized protein n=1 Tax=Nocardia fluminea TaxID=134984 RepID=A0A2N3VCX8_9NOCA|nr:MULTISPECIES: hypothetical protein [Nocardia]MBW0275276.1 hypothetical protein [Nocardia sp. MH4]PKV79484.1 hypothetical protein ATK86_3878 [Nocardia fluminea]
MARQCEGSGCAGLRPRWINGIDAITEHQPAAEMARTHPAEYETLTRQPGFIAYRLAKPATSDGGIDDDA